MADGPVVDGPAMVNGGIQHREAGVSEVAMDVGFSEIGEQLQAPTTTITTVAVQAGKAKIVLAILKVRPRHPSIVRCSYQLSLCMDEKKVLRFVAECRPMRKKAKQSSFRTR